MTSPLLQQYVFKKLYFLLLATFFCESDGMSGMHEYDTWKYASYATAWQHKPRYLFIHPNISLPNNELSQVEISMVHDVPRDVLEKAKFPNASWYVEGSWPRQIHNKPFVYPKMFFLWAKKYSNDNPNDFVDFGDAKICKGGFDYVKRSPLERKYSIVRSQDQFGLATLSIMDKSTIVASEVIREGDNVLFHHVTVSNTGLLCFLEYNYAANSAQVVVYDPVLKKIIHSASERKNISSDWIKNTQLFFSPDGTFYIFLFPNLKKGTTVVYSQSICGGGLPFDHHFNSLENTSFKFE